MAEAGMITVTGDYKREALTLTLTTRSENTAAMPGDVARTLLAARGVEKSPEYRA